VRLFFALTPDAATRRRLSTAADQLILVASARAVSAANLHITLAFVGEVPDANLQIFREMGANLRLRQCVTTLSLWDYWPKSQALVLTARNNAQELAVQTDRLRAAVSERVRLRRDARAWRAHVTLARKVAQAPVLPVISPIEWISSLFCLMSSSMDGNESVYTVVDSWPLLDKT
jgi:2'-5' RNA ligase